MVESVEMHEVDYLSKAGAPAGAPLKTRKSFPASIGSGSKKKKGKEPKEPKA